MAKTGKTHIFILGGALIKDAGAWRTTNYDEGDNFGVSGDRLRVLAAAYLHKKEKNIFFTILGGRGQLKNIPGSPPVAAVMKKELINLKVPAKNIAIETKSGNTYQQLLALKNIAQKKKISSFGILSNNYHFFRIKAMIKKAPRLNGFNKFRMKYVSAETVAAKNDPAKWKKIIDKARASKAMKERLKLEKRGVRQINNGTYAYENKNK